MGDIILTLTTIFLLITFQIILVRSLLKRVKQADKQIEIYKEIVSNLEKMISIHEKQKKNNEEIIYLLKLKSNKHESKHQESCC